MWLLAIVVVRMGDKKNACAPTPYARISLATFMSTYNNFGNCFDTTTFSAQPKTAR